MESGIFNSVFMCKECIAFISLSEKQVEHQETICSSKLLSANTCSKKFSRDVSQDPLSNAWGPRSQFLWCLYCPLSSHSWFLVLLFFSYIFIRLLQKMLRKKKSHMCLSLISSVCHLFSWGAILLHEGAYYFLLYWGWELGPPVLITLPKSQGQQQWKLADA